MAWRRLVEALWRDARLRHAFFAIYLLVWASGAAEQLLMHAPHRERQILAVANALVALILLRPASDRLGAALRALWPIAPPVLFAALSCLWSLRPLQTARGVVMLVGTVIMGTWIADRFSVREQLKLLAAALTIAAVAAVGVVYTLPQFGVMPYLGEPAWRGGFGHKNTFGGVMALLALAAWLLALAEREARRGWLAVWLFALWLLVQSASRSGQLVAIASCAAALLCVALRGLDSRGRRIAFRVLAAGSVTLLVALAAYFPAAMELLGRDATLSSRTRIWAVMWNAFQEHPWFGYGHDAFWTGATQAAVGRQLHFDPRHGHNGFFDIAVELGALGLVTFAVPFLICVRRAFRVAFSARALVAVWPLSFLIFLLCDNLAGSRLMRENRLNWLIYVTAVVNTATMRAGRARSDREENLPAFPRVPPLRESAGE